MEEPPTGSEPSRALVPVSGARPPISASLDSSRPGELLLLDSDGQVMSPSRRAWFRMRALVSIGATSGIVAAYGWWLMHSFFGLVAPPAMFLLWIYWRTRHGREIRDAAALVAAQRDQEAWAALGALSTRRLLPLQRLTVEHLRGHVAWRLGRLDDALAAFTFAAEGSARTTNRWFQTTYFLCQFQRAQLLCITGRLDEARALLPVLDKAPEGDYFRLGRIYVALQMAFAARSSAGLTDDLYEWAKVILRTNRFGSAAVLLAWAFAERADNDMARHMLEEAGPRLRGEPLHNTGPRLYAWYLDQCAKWKIRRSDESPVD